MNQLTFIDKIQVLFRLLFSSPVIIGIFVFSLILMILLFFNSKLNKKLIKFLFMGLYIAIIVFVLVKYGNSFLSSLDSFVTLFMANIYFPTIPVYVLIMIISFVIMLITLSSKKNNKIFKIINTVFFTFIQMLFVIFVYVVESNNIDVSANQNLYSNEQTLTLLELGMGLFVIWIIVLLICLYLKKADKIFKSKNVVEEDDFEEYINDYNEPGMEKNVVNNTSTSFNNNIVQSLVPEMGLFDSVDEEILDFDLSNTDDLLKNKSSLNIINNNVSNNINNNIFENFDFLDVDKENRRNSDVDIIEFDS